MARLNQRHSGAVNFDSDEAESRASTPVSTAPNDRKRMRFNASHDGGTPGPLDRRNGETSERKTQSSAQYERKFALQPKRIHQPGAIVRVKLIDFVTYTSAEFNPGPNLNMVIGPNGTGKSTLVCAICLGLGWSPEPLGRAKDPTEFVKHGCKEATIEIELQRATMGEFMTSTNPIITRTISKNNKSKFWLNGKQSTNKAVRELARSFNIQIDNLCQFLPQDRVVEFASLKPVQMLETTLEAAADHDVLDHFAKLKDMRAFQKDLMHGFKGDRELLESEEKRQEMQRPEVERMKDRQIIQKRLDNLSKCRPVPKYMEAKKRTQILRAAKTRLTDETSKLKSETAPALRNVNAKQAYATEAKVHRDNAFKQVKRAGDQCAAIAREAHVASESAAALDKDFIAMRKKGNEDKQMMGRYHSELALLKGKKQSPPEEFDSRAMNEQIQSYVRQARGLQDRGDDIQKQTDTIVARGRFLQEKQRRLQAELSTMSTDQGQRLTRFKNLPRISDTIEAWTWIQENRHMFKQEVFGPPGLTCSIKKPDLARHVETLINGGDLKIITVQCREDFQLLQRVLNREKKLHDITLRTCDKTDLLSFKAPVREEEMRQMGLDQWVIDLMEGPPQVLAMLCTNRSLHQTAFARDDMTDEQQELINRSQVKAFFARDKLQTITRRQEYGESVVTSKDLSVARIWTDQPIATGRQDAINRELKDIKMEIFPTREAVGDLRQEAERLKQERDEINASEKRLRDEKETKQRILTEYNNLDTRIDDMQDKIKKCEERMRYSKNKMYEIGAQKDGVMFRKAETVLRYCDATSLLKDTSGRLLDAEILCITGQNEFEVLKQQNQDMLETLKLKEAELKSAEMEHERARSKAHALADELKKLSAEADMLVEEEDDESLHKVMEELTDTAGVDEQKLEDLIDIEQARLELTAGSTDALNAVKEFEERAKKIEKIKTKLERFYDEQQELISGIREIRNHFEAGLEPIVTQIDTAFGESFARIGCAGQVAIYKASSEDPADCTEVMGGQENGLDFASWAIHISVKFRESEPLKLLDQHRQSGGERAVSTIFYLMALQSLSKSPFRVVDEINQGMDPRNERMVHGRMVDIAAPAEGNSATGSQYFLITPKLLSGLKYKAGMTVLCIVSGENMPSVSDVTRRDEDGNEYVEKGRTIDFGAYARKARGLSYATGGLSLSERRAASGTGLGVAIGA